MFYLNAGYEKNQTLCSKFCLFGPVTLTGMKAATIKNRLSSAFSGLKKLKSKQGSQEESPGGSEPATPAQEALEAPLLPVLHQDDLGFPLPIFTKVSMIAVHNIFVTSS